MDWIIKAAQLFLSLAILVSLHELGHFIPAKLFKTRVEKFYLFFNPWFSLFKIQKGETEYGIGWLPLGGYVKIAGMIDESMDKEQMKKDPEPWEFRSKPAWQRLIIMLGGVTVNVILGIAIYIGIAFVWGDQYIPTDGMEHGIYVDSYGESLGLRSGDRLVGIDGKPYEKFNELMADIIITQPQTIQAVRDGESIDIPVPTNLISDLIESENVKFIQPAFPAVISKTAPGSPADEAGLLPGDQIIKVDKDTIPFFQDLKIHLDQHAGQMVNVAYLRDGSVMNSDITVGDDGKLGFYPEVAGINFKTQEYDALTAIPAGFNKGIKTFGDYLKQLQLIFNPETGAYKSLGGFITIGDQFDASWNWEKFWTFTAFLSIVLAIMNLLPIPALDGGHVMFLLYEMIAGRKPHEKVMEIAQVAGMIILFSLLIFANANDFIKLFR